MYKHCPPESWLSKGIRHAEGALKVYGTARGLYEMGTAVAGGLRSAYQVAGPALAML